MNDEKLSALRATAHPLRLRMLSLLTAAPMSAAEVARELEITHANASYHLRALLAGGAVVIEGEERIRGGVAKRYRYRWQSDPFGRESSAAERGQFLGALSGEVSRRYEQLRETDRAILADAEVWIPPAAWEEASRHLRAASDLVHREAQAPRTEGAVHVSLTAIGFEMTEPDRAEDPADDGEGAGRSAGPDRDST